MKVLVILAVVVIAVVTVLALLKSQKKPAQQPVFKTTDEMMVFLAAEAVKDAEKENKIKLDYSTQSIEKVEEVLGSSGDTRSSGDTILNFYFEVLWKFWGHHT